MKKTTRRSFLLSSAVGVAGVADDPCRSMTFSVKWWKENPIAPPNPTHGDAGSQCKIVSKYPGHTWHADLTAVPFSGGCWTNWTPNASWQPWPVVGIDGDPGAPIIVEIDCHEGRRHLPIIRVRPAA